MFCGDVEAGKGRRRGGGKELGDVEIVVVVLSLLYVS